MDGVSAAASIVGLLGFAIELTETVYGFIKGVHDAPKEVHSLKCELQMAQEIMESLHDVIDLGSFSPPASLSQTVEETIDELQALRNKLEKWHRSSKIRQAAKRLMWPIKEDERRKTVENLQRYICIFQLALTMDGREMLSKTTGNVEEIVSNLEILVRTSAMTSLEVSQILGKLDSIPDDLDEIKKSTQNIEKSQYRTATQQAKAEEEITRVRILGSISSLNFRAKHNDVLGQRQHGTGGWFLDCAQVQAWLYPLSTSILWVSGDPGAGKTVMISAVIEHVTSSPQIQTAGQKSRVAYAYCQYKDAEIRTTGEILSSLTQQVARQHSSLPDVIRTFYYDKIEPQKVITIEDYTQLLLDLAQPSVPAYIFIDALDECSDNTREELLDVFPILKPAYKIFVTSRSNVNPCQSLEDFVRVQLRADESDVRAYLKANIRRRKRLARFCTQDPLLESEMITTISEKASGVQELRHALSVELEDTDLDSSALTETDILIGVCAGLVVVDEQSSVLRLVHFSLQEYLDEVIYGLVPGAELEISSVCLTYLNFDVFARPHDPKSYAFAEYASVFWVDHLRGPREEKLMPVAIKFLMDRHRVSSVVRKARSISDGSSNFYFGAFPAMSTPLHAAIHWGLERLVPVLLKHTKYIDASDFRGQTALHCAVEKGNVPILQAILDAQPTLDAQDSSFRTPLMIALQRNPTVAQILVDRGAHATVKGNSDDFVPLVEAASRGYFTITTSLLENGAGSRTTTRDRALFAAAVAGYPSIVRLLWSYGARASMAIEGNKFLMQKLVDEMNLSMIEIILETCLDVTPEVLNCQRILHRAATQDDEGYWHIKCSIIRKLVAYGADPNIRNVHGQTPLQKAAEYGNETVLRQLLQLGASVEVVNLRGETLLHTAAASFEPQTMSLLLRYMYDGSHIDDQDMYGQTALHKAAIWNRYPIMKKLLGKKARVDVLDLKGQTPLHLAAQFCDTLVLELLINHHACVDARDFCDQTPLHRAVSGPSPREQCEFLLRSGANVNAVDRIGLTALHIAMLDKNEHIGRYLLRCGANINAEASPTGLNSFLVSRCQMYETDDAEQNVTALLIAAWLEEEKSIKMLLHAGASVEVAFHKAFWVFKFLKFGVYSLLYYALQKQTVHPTVRAQTEKPPRSGPIVKRRPAPPVILIFLYWLPTDDTSLVKRRSMHVAHYCDLILKIQDHMLIGGLHVERWIGDAWEWPRSLTSMSTDSSSYHSPEDSDRFLIKVGQASDSKASDSP